MTSAAAIYVRISDDREDAGLGVRRQEDDCRSLAEKVGWTVARVYSDNDVSAYSGRPRPEYLRMLEDLREGRADAVLAWHPDRLHRSPREMEEFIDVCDTRGVAVQTVQAGTVDLSSPSGRAVARTLGAWARYESEHKSERIRRKAKELAQSGRPSVGGSRGFGHNGDRTAIVRQEADLVREAAERVIGGDSLRAIAADWQERGVKTPEGGSWIQTTLRRMLVSRRLTGQREHGGEVVATGGFPAILDEATSERVRMILLDPRRSTRLPTARRYLLTGLLRCSRCESQMVGRRRSDKVRRYVCVKGPGLPGCGGTFILAEPLEALVTEMVLDVLSGPELEAALRARHEASALGAELEVLQADEASLKELSQDFYVDRTITKAQFFAASDALHARIEAARDRMAAREGDDVLGSLAGQGTVVRDGWAARGPDSQRSVMAAILDHITIAPGRRGYNRFEPDRIKPVWRY